MHLAEKTHVPFNSIFWFGALTVGGLARSPPHGLFEGVIAIARTKAAHVTGSGKIRREKGPGLFQYSK